MKATSSLKFNGVLLDNFLAHGCYRMRQDIFTTDFICNETGTHPVFWLRFTLKNFQFSNKATKLFEQNNSFKTTIKKFQLTDEINNLYHAYFEAINFDAPHKIEDFLFTDNPYNATNNLFETSILEIRDGNKLIAAGIFDSGFHAIAGIMNFYEPSYKKYSLGKYLMLKKIQHAVNNNIQFYYPGYIAYGYNKFNYKLFPNPCFAEIFDSKNKQWLPFSNQAIEILVARCY